MSVQSAATWWLNKTSQNDKDDRLMWWFIGGGATLIVIVLTCIGLELHDRRKAREWAEWEREVRRQMSID